MKERIFNGAAEIVFQASRQTQNFAREHVKFYYVNFN